MIFITRIPTHTNDGKRVAKKRLRQITEMVYQTFGGYTLDGPGRGVWVDDEGGIYLEESYRLEVACERDRYLEAREMVIAIGRQLQQKAMYFEVRYLDGVEIIDIN